MERVLGLDEIRLRYTEEFIVETSATLRDDILMAYKLSPLKPIAMAATGGNMWPFASGKAVDNEDRSEAIRNMGVVVARSIIAARELVNGEDGAWIERWTPIEVICDRAVNPNADVCEIPFKEIDYLDTVVRCWNELLRRFQLQSGNGRSAGRTVRREGTRKPRNSVKDVGQVAARTGAGKKRRTNVRRQAASG